MGATVNMFCNKRGCHRRFLLDAGFITMPHIYFMEICFGLELWYKVRKNVYILVISCFNILMHKFLETNLASIVALTAAENYYFKINYANEEHSPCYYCPHCGTKMESLNTNWLTMCNSNPLQLFNDKAHPIKLCCPDCGSEGQQCYDVGFDWD